MNPALFRLAPMLLSLATLPALAQAPADTPASALLRSVADLAQANGLALGCKQADAQRRVKALMLQHAPATDAVREAFEAATQRSYLAVTRGEQACPEAAALNVQVESLGLKLQAATPAKAP